MRIQCFCINSAALLVFYNKKEKVWESIQDCHVKQEELGLNDPLERDGGVTMWVTKFQVLAKSKKGTTPQFCYHTIIMSKYTLTLLLRRTVR
jgi:hypothetical protein